MLMNKIFRLKLLYWASRDGDSSASFHNKCDNIRGTITFVKTKTGLIFGGYTGETWNDGSCCYKTDSKAFCFSIDLRKKYKSKKTIYSIYINKNKGPCFGNALFWVNNNCFKEGGFMNVGFNMNYDNQKKENEIK